MIAFRYFHVHVHCFSYHSMCAVSRRGGNAHGIPQPIGRALDAGLADARGKRGTIRRYCLLSAFDGVEKLAMIVLNSFVKSLRTTWCAQAPLGS